MCFGAKLDGLMCFDIAIRSGLKVGLFLIDILGCFEVSVLWVVFSVLVLSNLVCMFLLIFVVVLSMAILSIPKKKKKG